MTAPQREISLYQAYLAADATRKKVASAGHRVGARVEIKTTWWPDAIEKDPSYTWNYPVSIMLDMPWDATAEDREAIVADLLTKTDASLVRADGRMYLVGTTGYAEIPYIIWCGEGVCERVVVGTRKVLKPDPSAPLIEVEEPITQIRCPDPIVAAGLN